MTEIGIESLSAGHSEEDQTQYRQPDQAVRGQELGAVIRIESKKHLRIIDDVNEPPNREHGEPEQHDGPEETGHTLGAP